MNMIQQQNVISLVRVNGMTPHILKITKSIARKSICFMSIIAVFGGCSSNLQRQRFSIDPGLYPCNETAVYPSLKNSSGLPDRYFYPINNYFNSIDRKIEDFDLSIDSTDRSDTILISCQKKPTSTAEAEERKWIIGNASGEDGTLFFDKKCNRPIKYLLWQ